MSGGRPKPPPPIVSRPSFSDTGVKGAEEQIVVLCQFLLREFLNKSPDEISAVFEAYGDNVRDLRDNIIHSINENPGHMKRLSVLTRGSTTSSTSTPGLASRIEHSKRLRALRCSNPSARFELIVSTGHTRRFCRRKPHHRLVLVPSVPSASPRGLTLMIRGG